VILSHYKAAKSKDISPEGSFEFLWQLKLSFDYELSTLLDVSLKVVSIQTSSRFLKTQWKDLQQSIKAFNEIDFSRAINETVGKTSKQIKHEHQMRKKMRHKLRLLPHSEWINPTLRRDCTLSVKVIEAKELEGPRTSRFANRKRRSSSFLAKFTHSASNNSGTNNNNNNNNNNGGGGGNDPSVSSNPYCVVKLGSQKQRTRTIFDTRRPYWFEEYSFEVLRPNADILKILVWDAQHANPDTIIGTLEIAVNTLRDQDVIEDWFQLESPKKPSLTTSPNRNNQQSLSGTESPNGSSPMSSPMSSPVLSARTLPKPSVNSPSIRLKLRYSEEIVLPGPLYDDLLELLTDRNLTLVKLLGEVTSEGADREDCEHLIQSIVRVFEEKNIALNLLSKLTQDEIETSSSDTLFRANSLATKTVELYMKFIGSSYLNSTLSPFIKKIYQSKKSYEVDPDRLEKGISKEKSFRNLYKLVQNILNAIFISVDACPSILRELFYNLQTSATYKFSDEPSSVAKYTVVGGFIFLRFFCPALMAPKFYGIIEDHPDLQSNRTLMLVAKIIQKLANLTTFKHEEDFMNQFNVLLEENKQNLMLFIEAISKIPSNQPPRVRPPIVTEKELACIHRYLKKYRDKIIRLCIQQEVVILE